MTIKQQGGIFGRNPTFNDVDVEGALTVAGLPVIGGTGTMAAQDANAVAITGGNIDGTIIGATTKADVTGASGAFDSLTASGTQPLTINTTANNQIKFQVSGADTGQYLSTATYPHWFTDAAGTGDLLKINTSGNLVVNSGSGIDFSATSGTGTSELFDDYEEGTYTATFTPETSGSITVNPSFDTLQYTKIGRSVTVSGFLQVSSVSSPVGGSVKVSLPFNIASLSKNGGYIGTSCYAKGAVQAVLGFNGNAFVYITVDASTVASPDNFRFSFSFIAA
jgi:hypothetical protein